MAIVMVCMQLIFNYLNFKTKFLKCRRKDPYKEPFWMEQGEQAGEKGTTQGPIEL